jgi:hypothetical protein
VIEASPSFFTVSDSRFFVGTVAMLNSLRLTGNGSELVVIDTGLTDEQRRRLDGAATLVTVPPEIARGHPLLVKPTADLFREGTIVLIDSDMLVVRRLDEAVAAARSGKIFVYPDHEATKDRRFDLWTEALELTAPLRPRRYVNAGFVALSLEHRRDFLERWRRACARIPPGAIGGDPAEPFYGGDQEALNALLMSEIPDDAQEVGAEGESLHPDALRHVEVVDEEHLICLYRGRRAAILHYSLAPKPWEARAWRRLRSFDAYVRLFPRVAFRDDVPVRLRPEEVAFWLRPGRLARASVVIADATNRTIEAIRDGNAGPLRPVAERLARARRVSARAEQGDHDAPPTARRSRSSR